MDLPSTSTQKHEEEFSMDRWELEFCQDLPELADYICFIDKIAEEHLKNTTVSKKQQKRDRISRLEEMVLPGRTLMEKGEKATISNRKWKNVLERMKEFGEDTPLGILAKAVREERRVEIRTHNHSNIDRIIRGIPTSFDCFVNCVLRNVIQLRIASSNSQNLPEFLRWTQADPKLWPIPNQNVESRKQRACFVKGDNIVLIRLLN